MTIIRLYRSMARSQGRHQVEGCGNQSRSGLPACRPPSCINLTIAIGALVNRWRFPMRVVVMAPASRCIFVARLLWDCWWGVRSFSSLIECAFVLSSRDLLFGQPKASAKLPPIILRPAPYSKSVGLERSIHSLPCRLDAAIVMS